MRNVELQRLRKNYQKSPSMSTTLSSITQMSITQNSEEKTTSLQLHTSNS